MIPVNYNGNVIQFPDGMSPDQIDAEMRKISSGSLAVVDPPVKSNNPFDQESEANRQAGLMFDVTRLMREGYNHEDAYQLASQSPSYQRQVPQGEAGMNVVERLANDVPISFQRGVQQLPGQLAGLAHIGAAVMPDAIGQPIRQAADIVQGAADYFLGTSPQQQDDLRKGYTPEQLQAFRNVNDAKGLLGTVGAVAMNPSTALHTAVESLPGMVAGGVAGRAVAGALKAGSLAAPATAAIIGAGAGEGLISAVQTAQQIEEDTGQPLTPGQAGIAAGSGLLTSVLGFFGGKLSQHFGFTDPDSAISGLLRKGTQAEQKSLLHRVIGGAIAEGLIEEFPQSFQEQVAQNWATGKPLMEGAINQAVQGMFSGALTGAGANVISGANDAIKDTLQSRELRKDSVPDLPPEALTPKVNDSPYSTVKTPDFVVSKDGVATPVTPTSQQLPTIKISNGQEFQIDNRDSTTTPVEHQSFFKSIESLLAGNYIGKSLPWQGVQFVDDSVQQAPLQYLPTENVLRVNNKQLQQYVKDRGGDMNTITPALNEEVLHPLLVEAVTPKGATREQGLDKLEQDMVDLYKSMSKPLRAMVVNLYQHKLGRDLQGNYKAPSRELAANIAIEYQRLMMQFEARGVEGVTEHQTFGPKVDPLIYEIGTDGKRVLQRLAFKLKQLSSKLFGTQAPVKNLVGDFNAMVNAVIAGPSKGVTINETSQKGRQEKGVLTTPLQTSNQTQAAPNGINPRDVVKKENGVAQVKVTIRRRNSMSMAAPIDTPEFKSWFGNSKVTDGDGKPLVVYKGIPKNDESGNPITEIQRKSEFPAFNNGEKGVKISGFFTSEKRVEDHFANNLTLPGQSHTLSTYLRIENPYIIDMKGGLSGNAQFGREGIVFREAIRSGKYDGVIIKNTKDEGDVYVILDPNQVKSIENSGEFSVKNNDIYSMATPETKTLRQPETHRKPETAAEMKQHIAELMANNNPDDKATAEQSALRQGISNQVFYSPNFIEVFQALPDAIKKMVPTLAESIENAIEFSVDTKGITKIGDIAKTLPDDQQEALLTAAIEQSLLLDAEYWDAFKAAKRAENEVVTASREWLRKITDANYLNQQWLIAVNLMTSTAFNSKTKEQTGQYLRLDYVNAHISGIESGLRKLSDRLAKLGKFDQSTVGDEINAMKLSRAVSAETGNTLDDLYDIMGPRLGETLQNWETFADMVTELEHSDPKSRVANFTDANVANVVKQFDSAAQEKIDAYQQADVAAKLYQALKTSKQYQENFDLLMAHRRIEYVALWDESNQRTVYFNPRNPTSDDGADVIYIPKSGKASDIPIIKANTKKVINRLLQYVADFDAGTLGENDYRDPRMRGYAVRALADLERQLRNDYSVENYIALPNRLVALPLMFFQRLMNWVSPNFIGRYIPANQGKSMMSNINIVAEVRLHIQNSISRQLPGVQQAVMAAAKSHGDMPLHIWQVEIADRILDTYATPGITPAKAGTVVGPFEQMVTAQDMAACQAMFDMVFNTSNPKEMQRNAIKRQGVRTKDARVLDTVRDWYSNVTKLMMPRHLNVEFKQLSDQWMSLFGKTEKIEDPELAKAEAAKTLKSKSDFLNDNWRYVISHMQSYDDPTYSIKSDLKSIYYAIRRDWAGKPINSTHKPQNIDALVAAVASRLTDPELQEKYKDEDSIKKQIVSEMATGFRNVYDFTQVKPEREDAPNKHSLLDSRNYTTMARDVLVAPQLAMNYSVFDSSQVAMMHKSVLEPYQMALAQDMENALKSMRDQIIAYETDRSKTKSQLQKQSIDDIKAGKAYTKYKDLLILARGLERQLRIHRDAMMSEGNETEMLTSMNRVSRTMMTGVLSWVGPLARNMMGPLLQQGRVVMRSGQSDYDMPFFDALHTVGKAGLTFTGKLIKMTVVRPVIDAMLAGKTEPQVTKYFKDHQDAISQWLYHIVEQSRDVRDGLNVTMPYAFRNVGQAFRNPTTGGQLDSSPRDLSGKIAGIAQSGVDVVTSIMGSLITGVENVSNRMGYDWGIDYISQMDNKIRDAVEPLLLANGKPTDIRMEGSALVLTFGAKTYKVQPWGKALRGDQVAFNDRLFGSLGMNFVIERYVKQLAANDTNATLLTADEAQQFGQNYSMEINRGSFANRPTTQGATLKMMASLQNYGAQYVVELADMLALTNEQQSKHKAEILYNLGRMAMLVGVTAVIGASGSWRDDWLQWALTGEIRKTPKIFYPDWITQALAGNYDRVFVPKDAVTTAKYLSWNMMPYMDNLTSAVIALTWAGAGQTEAITQYQQPSLWGIQLFANALQVGNQIYQTGSPTEPLVNYARAMFPWTKLILNPLVVEGNNNAMNAKKALTIYSSPVDGVQVKPPMTNPQYTELRPYVWRIEGAMNQAKPDWQTVDKVREDAAQFLLKRASEQGQEMTDAQAYSRIDAAIMGRRPSSIWAKIPTPEQQDQIYSRMDDRSRKIVATVEGNYNDYAANYGRSDRGNLADNYNVRQSGGQSQSQGGQGGGARAAEIGMLPTATASARQYDPFAAPVARRQQQQDIFGGQPFAPTKTPDVIKALPKTAMPPLAKSIKATTLKKPRLKRVITKSGVLLRAKGVRSVKSYRV